MLSSIGSRDLISNSTAGANYGYSLIWTLLLVAVAQYVILEATARYVLASGETLLSGFRRVGAWAAWTIMGAIICKRLFSNVSHMLLMGLSLALLAGADSPAAAKAGLIVSVAAAFYTMYKGGYPWVESWSKGLVVLLGGSILLTAALAHPVPAGIVKGLVTPTLPPAEGAISPLLVIVMLIGGGVGSTSNLKYAAFIFEKGWRDVSFMRRQRFDVLVSVLGVFAAGALIQVAAAGALPGLGDGIDRIEDLIRLFGDALGPAGQALICVCLWTTVFSTYLGSNTGYSLMAADLIVKAPHDDDPTAAAEFERRRRQVYRLFLIGFCVPPLYVLWTDWKPLPMIIVAAALSAAALPLIAVILLIMTSNKRVMGPHVNTAPTNALLIGIVFVSVVVTWQAAFEFLGKYVSGF